jgi:hypothetical protein
VYQNRNNRTRYGDRPFFITALLLFLAVPLSGCAISKRYHEPSDASDTAFTEKASSVITFSDASITDSQTVSALDPMKDAETDNDEYDAAPPPEEVLDDLGPLSEPDFSESLETLAAERCGYLFTAEAVISSKKGTVTIVETRSFDSIGRLIAAEIQLPESVSISHIPTVMQNRRLQIDYDPTGRPLLVRLGPMFQMPIIESAGSIVRIEYRDDGSYVSRYITDETELISKLTAEGFDYVQGPATGEGFFCEKLHFDRGGNLLQREWDCAHPTVVQSRSYDERQRPVTDRGLLMFNPEKKRPLPIGWSSVMQNREWQIDFAYDDVKHSSTLTWNDVDRDRQAIYEILDNQLAEHRLVRTYDDTGQRVLAIDYDYGNDARFDEQTIYTYQGGELLSKKTDFWRDGIVDIVEIHNRSTNGLRVERRNMTVYSDRSLSSFSTDGWGDSFADVSSTLPPQSQAVTEYQYDEQSRPIVIDLEMRKSGYYSVENSDKYEQSLVSESWHETLSYADQGYVEKKESNWNPSNLLLEEQNTDDLSDQSEQDGPALFGSSSANTTTCKLTPLCPNAEVTLPEDMRLLSCEVAFIFPEYRTTVDIPSIDRDDIYAVPPYDTLPGTQNALKRSHSIYGFPGPPDVRDMVDY